MSHHFCPVSWVITSATLVHAILSRPGRPSWATPRPSCPGPLGSGEHPSLPPVSFCGKSVADHTLDSRPLPHVWALSPFSTGRDTAAVGLRALSKRAGDIYSNWVSKSVVSVTALLNSEPGIPEGRPPPWGARNPQTPELENHVPGCHGVEPRFPSWDPPTPPF